MTSFFQPNTTGMWLIVVSTYQTAGILQMKVEHFQDIVFLPDKNRSPTTTIINIAGWHVASTSSNGSKDNCKGNCFKRKNDLYNYEIFWYIFVKKQNWNNLIVWHELLGILCTNSIYMIEIFTVIHLLPSFSCHIEVNCTNIDLQLIN